MPGTLSRVAWLSVVFAAVRSARVEVKPPMDSSTEQKASSSPSFSYKRLNGPPADVSPPRRPSVRLLQLVWESGCRGQGFRQRCMPGG